MSSTLLIFKGVKSLKLLKFQDLNFYFLHIYILKKKSLNIMNNNLIEFLSFFVL